MRLRQGKSQRRAVAAVEMALVSIPIVILLAGTWEVGRLLEAHNLLTNAAREGGRQAATGTKTTTQVEDTVKAYLTRNGISTAGITITIVNLTNAGRSDPSTAVQLDHYRLTVTLPFSNVKWALIPQITSASTMTVTVDWYSMKDHPFEISGTVPVV